jgi:hypothetical protein
VNPRIVKFRTASSTIEFALPPRLIFTTDVAGVPAPAIQSNPAMTPDHVPEPLQSSTRTGTIVTPLATP